LDRWAGEQRGIVRIVTGGGKTIFAELCMVAFRQRYPEGRVIIVVPTTALLDQWVVSLAEDLGVSADEIACFSGDEKGADPKPVNVVVINTARTLAEHLATSQESMLIVDECHRAGSVQNALALRGRHAATLGLSATPEREHDEGFEEFVRPVLGPVIYEYGYVAAAKDGVISPFALHNVRVTMLPDEQGRYAALSKRVAVERRRLQKGAGSEERLSRLLQQRAGVVATATMRIPVAVKLAERHPGRRTIIFHERVEAADKLYEILKARRRSVTVYHAGIGAELRRDNLRLYRKGVFEILVCCRALDEGINVPETAVAIVASSTASTRQRVQRLGRVLRPAPGKAAADIYTIYASDAEEKRLMAEAETLSGVSDVTWLRVAE
jgi:superfamily II DNA or RNA helicase